MTKHNSQTRSYINARLADLKRDTIEKHYQHQKVVSELKSSQQIIDDALAKGQNDSLYLIMKKYRKSVMIKDSISKDLNKTRRTIDSLCLTLDHWDYMEAYLKNIVANEKEKKKEKIKDSTLIERFTISWFTATTSIGKSKLYEYNKSEPFENQINEDSRYDNSIGLAWNVYWKSNFMHQAWLFNIGLSKSLSNNTDTLSTTDITQEYAYKNITGDTTRKISQKYSAYTDPIVSKRQWNLYFNTYYIFGRNGAGLHMYSNYIKPKRSTGYFMTGIGFIVPFNPKKKDLPIINTETYIQTNDLFGGRSSGNFKQRSEIGVKFTLPFNFI
jgi:hypothetical protein